ncbi:MAG TPA: hypothetical protein VN541_20000 [Tepidisphaeraceae bacterium]|nr:hypothetical protein [Tepidisphaeraceae bacterium]
MCRVRGVACFVGLRSPTQTLRLFQQRNQSAQERFDFLRVEQAIVHLKDRRPARNQRRIRLDQLLDRLRAELVGGLFLPGRTAASGILSHGLWLLPADAHDSVWRLFEGTLP